jgi:uncharacterized membrane protein
MNRWSVRRSIRKPEQVAAVGFAVHAAALIGTPLRPKGRRATLASVVIAGLATSTGALTVRRWGPFRTMLAAVAVGTATWFVERVGTRTGRPFGEYDYTDELQPQIAGVPAVVPFAWFAMSIPARETAVALNRRWRIPLGAALLTGWDLFLDPQMVGEGYWKWKRGGRYRSVPLSNYLGWFATSFAIMVILDVLLPPGEKADLALVGGYAWMNGMETLGFAAFFDDPLVAAVGGAATVPAAFVALVRAWRSRTARG